MKASIIQTFEKVKLHPSLVQSVTNYVVMNNTANALLALGSSPIMAHAHEEMEEMSQIIDALVINIGTLDAYWVESMEMAVAAAQKYGKPWILDPVGAGASSYRNETLKKLLEKKPTVIRGNASEIMALAKMSVKSKGVDSTNSSDEAVEGAKLLSNTYGSVVCISGAIDYIIDGDRLVSIANGNPLMAKVTGMGCTATAVIGAFLGRENDPYLATVTAMGIMGVAGDIANEKAEGPGTLQLYFYDALYELTSDILMSKIKLEIYD
ncbi:hydroxyethylthiazole kinase [Belliella kenyensis]|uniref:Hydroxyethylthiazole kinase n=1 Tax=Belliella kenyensis TaxID=1472724 RepID=A0ABV8EFT7_9BACT|nr:hydroxyethylthiazole kinase [Belliella kenyensis]MCH7401763.1 hydroxyethylthiazole kinase [Belliella kenyensis]MDN3604262.1 hydroxyethylthiazole kinase [Belliella kenyensis]